MVSTYNIAQWRADGVFAPYRVLGLTSSIVELPFEVVSNTDLLIVIASSTMVILALVSSRNNTVNRLHRVLFVGLYLVYVVIRG